MKREAPYAAPAAAPVRFQVVSLPLGVSPATAKADDIKVDVVDASSEIEARTRVPARAGFYVVEVVPTGAESMVLGRARVAASELGDTPADLRAGAPGFISHLG